MIRLDVTNNAGQRTSLLLPEGSSEVRNLLTMAERGELASAVVVEPKAPPAPKSRRTRAKS